jgi:hypothetical protein
VLGKVQHRRGWAACLERLSHDEERAMPKQPIPTRLSYQDHVIQIDRMVHDALRSRNRIGSTHWDSGNRGILADSADHMILIRSGPSDVMVSIPAFWFRDPSASRHAIGAAVEEALAV